jgi:hypothetical protein
MVFYKSTCLILNASSRSGMGAWTGLSWLRIGTGGGLFECGNEPLGSIKCGEFLD